MLPLITLFILEAIFVSLLVYFTVTINYAVVNVTENYKHFERSIKVEMGVYDIIFWYQEMLRDKRLQVRQQTLDAFFKKESENYSGNEPHLPVRTANPYTLHIF
jgi:hypothetical protein